MNIGALSTNTTSTCAFAGTTAKANDLRKLQQGIENNLAKFRQCTVSSYPALGSGITYIPIKGHYWFSNEYSTSDPVREGVRLCDSFARLPGSKSLSDFRVKVAIIVGEGGFFQGLPELHRSCDLTVQIDRDPQVLQLSLHLLEECKKETSFPENHTDRMRILNRAITNFQRANPEVNAGDVSEMVLQFNKYIAGMECNIFSSAERFAEFKRCQDHPVQRVCLDLFSEEAMTALAETLKDHNADVRFLNINNVCEYPEEFYKTIPYEDHGTNIDFIPSRYIQRLPFSNDAICAYSHLFGGRLFTATATTTEIADALYGCAISGRDRSVRGLANKYDPRLRAWYFEQLLTPDMPLHHRRQIEELVAEYGTGPSLQLPTRIFRLFAEHPIHTMYDWILWLTAVQLTGSEVEELKVHKETLKADYLMSHPTCMSMQPPLFCKILDSITAEQAQADQPMDSSAQGGSLKCTMV